MISGGSSGGKFRGNEHIDDFPVEIERIPFFEHIRPESVADRDGQHLEEINLLEFDAVQPGRLDDDPPPLLPERQDRRLKEQRLAARAPQFRFSPGSREFRAGNQPGRRRQRHRIDIAPAVDGGGKTAQAAKQRGTRLPLCRKFGGRPRNRLVRGEAKLLPLLSGH